MEVLQCPQCGATAAPSQRQCEFCGAEFFIKSLAYLSRFDTEGVGKYLACFKATTISSPSEPQGWLGLGLCYLQMGTYALAERYFEKVIGLSPEIPQAYYYHALASIRGRRLKTLSLPEIRKIEMYLTTATQIDAELVEGQLLLAMIKRDFYESNGMKVPGMSSAELLGLLHGRSVSKDELSHLRTAVKVGDEGPFYGSLTAI